MFDGLSLFAHRLTSAAFHVETWSSPAAESIALPDHREGSHLSPPSLRPLTGCLAPARLEKFFWPESGSRQAWQGHEVAEPKRRHLRGCATAVRRDEGRMKAGETCKACHPGLQLLLPSTAWATCGLPFSPRSGPARLSHAGSAWKSLKLFWFMSEGSARVVAPWNEGGKVWIGLRRLKGRLDKKWLGYRVRSIEGSSCAQPGAVEREASWDEKL